MKKIEEYFVPWVKGIPMYISGHIELAWKKSKLHPRRPTKTQTNHPREVLEAIIKICQDVKPLSGSGLGGSRGRSPRSMGWMVQRT